MEGQRDDSFPDELPKVGSVASSARMLPDSGFDDKVQFDELQVKTSVDSSTDSDDGDKSVSLNNEGTANDEVDQFQALLLTEEAGVDSLSFEPA
jgi:hypothetical protein